MSLQPWGSTQDWKSGVRVSSWGTNETEVEMDQMRSEMASNSSRQQQTKRSLNPLVVTARSLKPRGGVSCPQSKRPSIGSARSMSTGTSRLPKRNRERAGSQGADRRTVRFISAKKNEPEWMLEWRLAAFKRWQTLKEPTWARVPYPKIDFQDIYYYAAPKAGGSYKSIDEVTPEILETYEKLGIPLREREILLGVEQPSGPDLPAKVAVDAVFDSVSVATTFREELAKAGVLFMSISEAIQKHPEIVRKYLGSVVPSHRQFLCLAEFGGVLRRLVRVCAQGRPLPDGVLDLFPHQRGKTGQFERTLIIADKGSYVSYLEGCTAPMRDENQLHAAVVELVALDDAEIKYSAVQNWYPATARAGAASIISSPNAATAGGRIPRSRGPRSRPARRSPGNIPAAS